ncbi:MAG: hypothetical protein ACYTDT_10420 [Planctomycetota bacterium]|jgi:hypothetical protein
MKKMLVLSALFAMSLAAVVLYIVYADDAQLPEPEPDQVAYENQEPTDLANVDMLHDEGDSVSQPEVAPDPEHDEEQIEEWIRFHSVYPDKVAERLPFEDLPESPVQKSIKELKRKTALSKRNNSVWGKKLYPADKAELEDVQKLLEQHLNWLNGIQQRDGSWKPEGIAGTKAAGAQDSKTQKSIFSTAMAMLANLRVGHTHDSGSGRNVLRNAVLFARRNQSNTGSFAEGVKRDPMLHHAAAVLAMCELYRMSNQAVLKPICDRGLRYLCQSGNRDGGWGSSHGSDVLTTGFALLALRSAQVAVLKAPKGYEYSDEFRAAANWVWTLRRDGFTTWTASDEDLPNVEDRSADSRVVADSVFVLALHLAQFQTVNDPTASLVIDRLLGKTILTDEETINSLGLFMSAIALWEVVPEQANRWSQKVVEVLGEHQINTEVEGSDPVQVLSFWRGCSLWIEKYGSIVSHSAIAISLAHCSHRGKFVDSESSDLVVED